MDITNDPKQIIIGTEDNPDNLSVLNTIYGVVAGINAEDETITFKMQSFPRGIGAIKLIADIATKRNFALVESSLLEKLIARFSLEEIKELGLSQSQDDQEQEIHAFSFSLPVEREEEDTCQ